MKTKCIIGLDLDGTIVDSKQQLNLPGFAQQIKRYQNSGYTFVLNSDSAVESLQEWQKKLGIDAASPIIAEKGGILALNGKIQYLDKKNKFFEKLRMDLMSIALTNTPKDWLILCGDTSLFPVQKIDTRSDLSKVLVVINRFRKTSLSFDLRRVTKSGTVVYCPKETQILFKLLKPSLAQDELAVSFDTTSGSYFSVRAQKQNNNKTKAFKKLISTFSKEVKYYMIGNEIMDVIEDERVNCACVKNTPTPDKKLFSYVAKSNYTKGVMEIIEKINQDDNLLV